MEKQKKNDSGITLVALVVSIIVMLVLAGVSINATIGDNGIVTRAQEAALKQKTAEDLENLNLELAKLNVDTISTDETKTIQDIANYLLDKNVIDSVVKKSSGQIAAGIDTSTGNRYFFGTKGDNTYKITRERDGLLFAELSSNASGGNIDGGYALVTLDSFNTGNDVPASDKGKFIITSDAEVVFMDSISGELSIYVKAGVHATVGIYADILLTNESVVPKRSAIEIEPTGSLDIYIGEKAENVAATLTVNSGFGEDGEEGNENGAKGGPGGYAGIHVPEGATLNLHGIGTVVAYGGNAGNGVDSSDVYGGGGGGRSWCWNRWKWR